METSGHHARDLDRLLGVDYIVLDKLPLRQQKIVVQHAARQYQTQQQKKILLTSNHFKPKVLAVSSISRHKSPTSKSGY